MKKTILTAIAGLTLMTISSTAETTKVTNEYIDGSKAICQSIRTNHDVVDHDRVTSDSEYARGVSEGRNTFSSNI